MDRSYYDRNSLDQRVEEWREQRFQKMAARLQLNASKPRTISSNVLGYGNYRQPIPVHLAHRQQQGEGPRFSHAGQSWNPNYNYSGYREHHSPHKQYHHADQRNHGYGHGSYHQQHAQKRGGHFSSHKSLYHHDKKSSNKLNKRYSSSCSNMNSSKDAGNQNVACPPVQTLGIASESEVFSSSLDTNVTTPDVNSEGCENVTAVIEDSCLNIEHEVAKVSDLGEGLEESSAPEFHIQDNVISGTMEASEISENQLYDPQSHVDGCVHAEGEIVSDISLVTPASNSSDNPPTLFVDESFSIAINIENSDITVVDAATISVDAKTISVDAETISVDAETISVDAETISVDAETISVDAVSETLFGVNDHETFEHEMLSQQTNISHELSEKNNFNIVSEPVVMVNSTIDFECSNVINSQTVTNVEGISEIEQVSSESNFDVIDETLNLELNLSFKPDIKVVEDTDEPIDPLKLDAEITEELASTEVNTEEGIGESYGGTSYHENTDVFPVALIVAGDSDTEASIFRYDDISSGSENDLTKEIEHVENKLANISIVNKDDGNSDAECFTPMKRERRQVLLDATNILPSSTIKFAVREVRKNDESEIIVTPVRRSARLSTLTPVSTPVHRSGRLSPMTSASAHKSICVQNLEELSPEIIQKMKFVQNPAIDNPSEF